MTLIFCFAIGTASSQNALVSWGPEKSPYKIGSYDCKENNVQLILIQGTIELVHPDDKPGLSPPPEIFIDCDKIMFAPNSKVVTMAALYIRGETSIGGAINIENRRGAQGADGLFDPNADVVRRAPNGPDGPPGQNGDDAEDTSIKYPLGRNAETGHAGGNGIRGQDGGRGSDASDGRDGSAAAAITLKARTYSPATTVVLSAIGGKGGAGGHGGRGIDGGDGGTGGTGGKGGDAAVGRTAATGGVGGAGGDGGNGGWGGPGGDGGNGGRGGDLNVYIIAEDAEHKGNPPSDFKYTLNGGGGGEPGIGGAPGAKGIGAKGGFGGCGGNGSNLGPIVFHPSGACAGQGPHGKDGRDGEPGPTGKWGRDGDPGRPGDWNIGFVVEKGGH
ncbi:hypothetical protein [Caballeronia insecticola]|uniref:hypothetical protein n=1 Tax=Caballeronia insecticola TaxID=758793 RepID=UPI0011846405|nr:hypothetical protein [Caballeronia insecticola]